MTTSLTPEILRAHGQFVQRLARSLLRDAHLAEDVAQEVWTRWLDRGAEVRDARGWLRRSVRDLASNALRARGRRRRHESLGASEEPAGSPADEAARAELLHQVVDAVFGLEEPYRETVLARHFRGLDARALARESGVPLATVRSREQRALAKLRERLDHAHGERASWAALLARVVGPPAGLAPSLVLVALVLVSGLAGVAWWSAGRSGSGSELVARGPSPSETMPEASVPAARATLQEEGDSRRVPQTPAAPEADTMPDELHRVVGTTVTPDGRPLGDVRVHLTGVDGEGEREHTVVSGGDGRFESPGWTAIERVVAEREGLDFLGKTEGTPTEDGTWPPVRLVLDAPGALALFVRDEAGTPLVDVGVEVLPLPEDLVDPEGTDRRYARTDAEGLARVEGVWSGLKLGIELTTGAPGIRTEWRAERQSLGRLVLEPDEDGTPLVVLPGGTLALEAVFRAPLVLHGRLVGPADEPVSAVSLAATDLGRGPIEPGRTLAERVPSDGDRFALTLRTAALRGPVLVTAVTEEARLEPVRSRDGRTNVSFRMPRLEGAVLLERADLERAEELVLDLRPSARRLAVVQVHDPSGEPLKRFLDLEAFQPDVDARPGPVAPYWSLLGDGPYVILGLDPGPFDVAVALEHARGSTGRFQLFENLVAAEPRSEEIPLQLAATSDVHVRVHLDGAVPPLWSVVLLGAFARDGGRLDVPRAPSRIALDRPGSWIDGIPLRGQPPRVAGASVWRKVVPVSVPEGATEVDVFAGVPGAYALGILTQDAGGNPSARVATPLLAFEAGAYTLHGTLPPIATLTGRVRGAEEVNAFLGLSLVDERGEPIPLTRRVDDPPRTVLPLATFGAFSLPGVPVGTHRLRVGRIEDLEAGRFRREAPVQVAAGGAWVELAW